jgi:hypothetical protein
LIQHFPGQNTDTTSNGQNKRRADDINTGRETMSMFV